MRLRGLSWTESSYLIPLYVSVTTELIYDVWNLLMLKRASRIGRHRSYNVVPISRIRPFHPNTDV